MLGRRLADDAAMKIIDELEKDGSDLSSGFKSSSYLAGNGEAFISQTAVAKLCGVNQNAISQHVEKTGDTLNYLLFVLYPLAQNAGTFDGGGA